MKIGRLAYRVQDRILTSFGRSPAARLPLIHAMLQPRTGDAAGYWLQLVIATMLATLGLALDSTAVVIGAMLIAPLMRPLVELAMGLATGSAALVLRVAVRTVASICLVTLVAFAITWLLPFHEITAELESRTAPSLLDLAVAGACALAAAYATLRADADIATTAAGTSIGISLVPPLCAVGYGLGIGDEAVWRGAALLFTANLSGILIVATIVFVLAGFGQVDIRHEEETVDETGAATMRLGRRWTLATARLGPVTRVVPPLLLLAIVYLPLQRAVGEIGHRSEIRRGVSDLLASDKRRIMQYTLDHTSSAVILRVVVVGNAHTASELEKELRMRLASLEVDNPRLSVWAVPDAASVSALTHRIDEIPPPAIPEPHRQVARRYSSDVVGAIRAAWPTSGTGELVGVWLDMDHPQRMRVIHLGAAIGPAGIQLLAHAVDADELAEDALLPIEAPLESGLRWLPSAIDLIARSRRATGVQLCVTLPAPIPPQPNPAPATQDVNTSRDVITSTLGDLADATIIDGDAWSIVPTLGPCAKPEATIAPSTLAP